MTCCVRRASRTAKSVGSASASSSELVCSELRAAEHPGQRLERRPDDVVVGLLDRERAAGGLCVEPAHPGPRVLCPESLPHCLGPDAASGAELGDLLEEIVVRVEEKGEPRRELVDRQPRLDAVLHVLDAVAQRKGQLLEGCRAGLPDVVAGDRDRVPPGHVLGAEGELVGDQPHRGARRIDVLLLRDVLLQDVVLKGAADAGPGRAVLLGHGEVHGQRDGRRRVDRHGCRHGAEVDAVEEHLHVPKRIHGDAALADLAPRHLMVGVVAVEGRQVKGRREAGLAVVEEIVKAFVRLTRRAVAGKLTHRPELAAVARRLGPARVGILARPGKVAFRVEPGQRVGPGQGVNGRSRDGREVSFPGRLAGKGLPALLVPSPAALARWLGDQGIVVVLVVAHWVAPTGAG